MEDKFIKEFENFCDIQLLKDYGNKIRTEIINGLENFQKRNDDFSLKVIHEESGLLFSVMRVFKSFNKHNSDEKVERLTKLFETYNCLATYVTIFISSEMTLSVLNL